MYKTNYQDNPHDETYRQELSAFANAMLQKAYSKLNKPDNRRGDPWNFDELFLRSRLQDEWGELKDAWKPGPVTDAEADELLDIANFCFYLWIKKDAPTILEREKDK